MSTNRTIERELEVIHHEERALDEQQTLSLINDLNALKLKFDALHQQLTRHSIFAKEHAKNKDNLRRGIDLNVSQKFSSQVVSEFVYLNSLYENIKQKLPASMQRDVIETENMVFTTAKISKKEFDALLFYPELQIQHMDYAQDYSRRLRDEQEALVAGQQSIYHQRAQSQARYNQFYKITGLLSLIGVGLPFLLTGLISNLVSRLNASLKMKQLKSELAEVENKKENNFHPNLPMMYTQIENQPSIKLRQGFFKAAKALTPLTNELEAYIPSEKLSR